MSLTNTSIRNARAARKTTKLFDERGLYMEVSTTGDPSQNRKAQKLAQTERAANSCYQLIALAPKR
jgi:hypothetical protein